MAEIRIDQISKAYGAHTVLHDITFDVEDGEFIVFVGPSGCGKTTLLRTIAGLEKSNLGRIVIGGKDVTHWPPARRGVAMVFQSYALYPHMTVAQNITYGLKVNKVDPAEIEARLKAAATMLQITQLLDRKPKELSGGQRQRVAIGRSIVRQPGVFLFDEPLSNLDAELRVQMRAELVALHRRLGSTMVYVTHDQIEAMTMANRIVVLRDGRIEQIGAPLDLYHNPQNRFVAGFIGSPKMNFLSVTIQAVSDAGVMVELPGGPKITVPVAGPDLVPGGKVELGIRPEHLLLGPGAGAADAQISVTATLVERLGGETLLHGTTRHGEALVVRKSGELAAHHDETVPVGVVAGLCYLFDADGRSLDPLRPREFPQ
ncbi:ABC transporter ATP-binding protein [Acidimangrovimonas sediminis]|uniref:ABC transporter ATP-binding protein n=1 Tax=Acidimangrovimonas sediminis TaxID=2056283 RepID=UPI000C7F8A08|nr:sn-glycerol-3-phosphate ABC transporter ATP-binding protein UgpC [Acidimangrovimonas sediminis]